MLKIQEITRVFSEVADACRELYAFRHYFSKWRAKLIMLVILTPLGAIPGLMAPYITKCIIDVAYPARDYPYLYFLCACLLSSGVAAILLSVWGSYLSAYISSLVSHRLVLDLYRGLSAIDPHHDQRQSSSIAIERLVNDAPALSHGITNALPQFASIVFALLTAASIMSTISLWITLLVLVVLPLRYGLTLYLGYHARALGLEYRKVNEDMVSFVSESWGGMWIEQIFGLRAHRRFMLGLILRRRINVIIASWRNNALRGQTGEILSAAWGGLLLFGGWILVFNESLKMGEAVALGWYISILSQPFHQLGELYKGLMSLSVYAKRIGFMLLRPRQDDDQKVTLSTKPQSLVLRNVSLRRADKTILRDVNLEFRMGEVVAVIGPKGSGKSSLLQILAGLAPRLEGEFLINGIEFRNLDIASYQRHVAWNPQMGYLFSDTVRNNIRSNGKALDTHRVARYAHIFGALNWAGSVDEGLNVKIGVSGRHLSGGETQEISILRSVLKEPAILLLDEICASSDVDSERRILEGLASLKRHDCLTVLVTHNMAYISEPWIDRVVVVSDGAICEQGAPSALANSAGLFATWLRSPLENSLTADPPEGGFSPAKAPSELLPDSSR